MYRSGLTLSVGGRVSRPHPKDDTTRNAIEPGVEGSVATKARQLAMDADEHFLRDILRVVFVAGEPNRPTEDDGPISLDERGERAFISLSCSRDDSGGSVIRTRRSVIT